MEEGSDVGLSRIPEAVMTYEQVLLSQINHCAKLSGLIIKAGTQTIHRDLDIVVCVNSLQSLLPIELRKKLEERINWFKRWIFERANRYECFRNKTCGKSSEEFKKFKAMVDEIANEASEQFPGYSHIINGFISFLLWPYEVQETFNVVSAWQFKLTLIVDLLAEEGIIGLKQPTLFVGGVKNVPK